MVWLTTLKSLVIAVIWESVEVKSYICIFIFPLLHFVHNRNDALFFLTMLCFWTCRALTCWFGASASDSFSVPNETLILSGESYAFTEESAGTLALEICSNQPKVSCFSKIIIKTHPQTQLKIRIAFSLSFIQ